MIGKARRSMMAQVGHHPIAKMSEIKLDQIFDIYNYIVTISWYISLILPSPELVPELD
jgi:hypothetical protein